MNVLLTGGLGYIGSHTACSLAASGFNPIILDNLSNSHFSVLERIEKICGRPVFFVNGDIRDKELLIKTFRENNIGSVVHFAGLKSVGESNAEPLNYYSNNVEGTIRLLEIMQLVGVKSIVFSSSATVYGEPQLLPIIEDHPTSAINPYARSKLFIEQILNDLARSEKDWRIICLRYFNPVGAHDSGILGENPNGIPNNLMPYIVQVAAGILKELTIFGNDYPTIDGTGVRDYIHIEDLALGHLAALKYLQKHYGWCAVNLGRGSGISVLEVVRRFESINNVSVPFRFADRRHGDVATCYADAKKAAQTLSWRAERSLEDMCKSAWTYWRNNYPS